MRKSKHNCETLKHDLLNGEKESYINFASFLYKSYVTIFNPIFKYVMQNQEKLYDVDLVIIIWFYDTCVPMNACNSSYFHRMVYNLTSIGER